MIRSFVVMGCMGLLSGCAHLTTYQADLGTPSTGVSMDAKQRVVLVNEVKPPAGAGEAMKRICAEPSPDALSAIGASLGATWGDPTATKQLAAALGETSASIGLRTTSIQLMRDAMYRVCEAYLSGGLDKHEYADLQGNAQNLVIGLLAVEQLTGAVQAQQVSVSSHGSAGTGGDVSKETEELFNAKKAVLAQQKQRDDLKLALEATEKKRDKKKAEVEAAKADATVSQERRNTLEQELLDLEKEVTAARDGLAQGEKLLSIEQAHEAVRQQALDFAKGRAKSAVSGRADFSQHSRGGMTGADAAVVSQAVTTIVKSVIGTGISYKRCLNLMSKELKVSQAQMDVLVALCKEALKDETLRQESLRRSAEAQLMFLSKSSQAMEHARGQGERPAPNPDSVPAPAEAGRAAPNEAPAPQRKRAPKDRGAVPPATR
jgi:hypothetical protein